MKWKARPGANPPPGDFDKVNLLRQAAARNYFTSMQVKALIDVIKFRNDKIQTAILLHPRTTDPDKFWTALQSNGENETNRDWASSTGEIETGQKLADSDLQRLTESDRQHILETVGVSVKRKMQGDLI